MCKRVLAALLLLISILPAVAQNSGCVPLQIISPPTPAGTGQPVINAPFRVCTPAATGVPCSPLTSSTIYYDPALANPQPNPSSTDGNGNLNFCAGPGNYLVQVTVSSLPPVTYSLYATVSENANQVVLLNPAGTQTITQSGGPLAIAGNMTVSGTLGVIGAISGPGTGITGTAPSLSVGQLLGATWASPPVTGYGSTTPEPVAASTLSLAGSQNFTSVQGTTGSKLPAASGTFTVNNLRSTDGNGNEVDSGISYLSVLRSLFTPPAVYTSGSGTYTTPVGARLLRIRMCGGGGGGAGGNGSVASNATGTTFNGSTYQAGGGGGGGSSGGGYYTFGSGGGTPIGGTLNIPGQNGAVALAIMIGPSTYQNGGMGGSGWFGAGGTANPNQSGGAATGYCAGGAGGGTDGTATYSGGGGGGAGGYLEVWIPSPSATYSYAVGAGSAGASGGTHGYAGGNGVGGIIIVEAY